MKKSFLPKMMIISLIMLIGFGGSALAYRGWNGGDCPGGGRGGQRDGGGYGFDATLTDDEIEKLTKERQDFFKQTQDLRNEINAKGLELRAEIAKKNPDVEKAATIQQELSALQAQFDLKRVEHRIKIKKINPNAGREFGAGKGKKGRGGRGSGYCQR